MSSRRRLDIGSLLCDSSDAPASASPTRPDIQQPGSPGLSRHQPRPTSLESTSRSSHERSIFADDGKQHDGPHYESVGHEQRRRRQAIEEGLGLASLSYQHHDVGASQRPLPVVPPLVLHSPSSQRRTSSTHYSLQSASPIDASGPYRRQRHSGDVRDSGFLPTQPQTHPHPFTQYPQSPSTSPLNVRSSTGSRRVSAQLSPHQHSSISFPHPSPSSPSLPGNFPSSVHPLSVSPTDSSYPLRPPTSSSAEKHLQRSPLSSHHPDASLYHSQRTSASLSPIIPMSGLSGLDVLVQAATEERERIDGHRRQSGGEELQPPLNHATSVKRASRSPVEHRSMELLRTHPPTPPYTASFHTIGSYRADPVEPGCNNEQGGSTVTGRLSAADAQVSPKGTFRRRSISPGATYVGHNRPDNRSPHVSSIIRVPLEPVPGTRYIESETAPTAGPSSSTTISDSERETKGTNIPVHLPRGLSPLESAATCRCPPRSKPKPKKPGSAALALMEKELQGSVSMDTKQKEPAIGHNTSSSRKHPPGMGPSGMGLERKLPGSNSRFRQSNERGPVEDEDVDSFFLSAFDSPPIGERQIPAGKPEPVAIPSPHDGEDAYFLERLSHGSSRHHNLHSNQIHAKILSIPEGMRVVSNELSSISDAVGFDEGTSISDVEAEILDELVDAVDAATSGDDGTEFGKQETDTMEVDVDNELLSLIDGSPEPSRKTQPSLNTASDLSFTNSQRQGSKKGTSKPKAKFKAGAAKKSIQDVSPQDELSTGKPLKVKATSKLRPSKHVPGERSKSAKVSKEGASPATIPRPGSATPAPALGTPMDGDFPTVTSSGRMVTKTKKSAAAVFVGPPHAPHVQTPGPHGRKQPGMSGSKDRSGKDGSGSRSHSVMPRASVDPENQRGKSMKDDQEKAKEKDASQEEGSETDKDKLYCICRTHYDEDRVMIACDRCDEWYHTACVNMPDLLIDLVDQFICAKCIANNPELNLKTTYKRRCFAGLNHPDPDSPEACHKASRGAFSKYCSDECGVKYMHRRIQNWASNGDVRGLWESVKDTKRREGFLTREPGKMLPKAILAEIQNNAVSKAAGSESDPNQVIADEEGRTSIIKRLEEQLQGLVREREDVKKELDVLSWREKLLQLAADRAENANECGWDQRLVYGYDEWFEFGAGVLESYEDAILNGHPEGMDVDGQPVVGEWWCRGKKKCERHMGWQKVRATDMENERATYESALADLTTREREIRGRMEDLLHPQLRPSVPLTEATFKFNLDNVKDGESKKAKKKAVPTA